MGSMAALSVMSLHARQAKGWLPPQLLVRLTVSATGSTGSPAGWPGRWHTSKGVLLRGRPAASLAERRLAEGEVPAHAHCQAEALSTHW